MRRFILAALASAVLAGACSYDENFYLSQIKVLDGIAAKADPTTRVKIAALKADLEQGYDALPRGEGRKEAVHDLGIRVEKAVEQARAMVAAAAAIQARVRREAAAKGVAKQPPAKQPPAE